MSRCNEFPLTRPLLSTSSAAGCPALFGRFFDNMGLSDSSGLCIIGYAFRLPSAPHVAFDRGEAGGLPDSSSVCPHMHGVSDPGWPQPVSHNDVLNVAFRLPRRRRHHRLEGFRGSTPSLCVPLSTLRPQPHDRRRMTRGRGGLLSLPRMALSSTTLCLLTGALRGSITRPAHSLSTLRHHGRPWPRKTRFRLLAKLCRAALATRWVPLQGFRVLPSHPPCPGFAWRTTIDPRDDPPEVG